MYSLLLEYRCTCHHLLFKGVISPGSRLQIKCKSCGKIVSLGGPKTVNIIDDYFVLLLGDRGQILDSSGSASKILGYQGEILRTMSIFDIVPAAQHNSYKHMWDILQKFPEQVFSSNTKFNLGLGENLMTRSRFRKHTLNGKPSVIVFYEVINRKADPQEVVFHSPNSLIFDLTAEVSSDGLFSYVSSELVKKIGVMSNVDVLGKKIFDFLPTEFAQSLEKDFELMTDMQQTIVFYGVNFINQSEKFDLLFSPTHHPDNRIKGFKLIIKPHNFHF